MATHLAAGRLDRKRRARARQLRRLDVSRAGRFAPVAWLAHLLTVKERT